MKFYYIFILVGLLNAHHASADIYKRVDADGVTYSSEPLKGGKKLTLEALPKLAPPNTNRRQAMPSNSTSDFPKVDTATQRNRDNTRYQILQNELTSEERALAEVRKANGRADEIQLHSKNIEALKTEISNLSH